MIQQILTSDQIALLKAIGSNRALAKQFYLSGGTALAGFYLHHRYSEDLDFFSEIEVDPMTIQTFFHKLKKILPIQTIDFQQSFNRNLFFLHLPSGVLKTEFTYFPFPPIEQGPIQYGVRVDSLLDIAVNKLFTIYQRTQARDYIDLYCICQGQNYTINALIKQAKIKFDWHIDPIQLGTQFTKAQEAPDYPRMITTIDPLVWQQFYIHEAEQLHSDILR